MIRAKRVLEVVDFLKPDEMWTTMAKEGVRITVFGAIDDVFKVEMSMPALSLGMTKQISISMLHAFKDGPESALAFDLVTMASRLGAYSED